MMKTTTLILAQLSVALAANGCGGGLSTIYTDDWEKRIQDRIGETFSPRTGGPSNWNKYPEHINKAGVTAGGVHYLIGTDTVTDTVGAFAGQEDKIKTFTADKCASGKMTILDASVWLAGYQGGDSSFDMNEKFHARVDNKCGTKWQFLKQSLHVDRCYNPGYDSMIEDNCGESDVSANAELNGVRLTVEFKYHTGFLGGSPQQTDFFYSLEWRCDEESWPPAHCFVMEDTDRKTSGWNRIDKVNAVTAQACNGKCLDDSRCQAWVNNPNNDECWLSSSVPKETKRNKKRTYGQRCDPDPNAKSGGSLEFSLEDAIGATAQWHPSFLLAVLPAMMMAV